MQSSATLRFYNPKSPQLQSAASVVIVCLAG